MDNSVPGLIGKPDRKACGETLVWESVDGQWHQLGGGFKRFGYSIEWHDFVTERDLDWSRSFHQGGLEICLNISGKGEVRAERHMLELGRTTAGFYVQRRGGL